jgi:ribosomal RNA assembly protein
MMEEYSYDLKIPKERVAVLIGKGGEVKKEIEEISQTTLDIDSQEGDIHIKGKDPIKLYTAKDVVHAIGRGFNPEIAISLFKSDYSFELLNLHDYIKSPNDKYRLKGRVIGKEGKSRQIIEDLINVNISVYGKTIGIIGMAQFVMVARRAIESLLTGSPHSKIYKWLETQRRELKKSELLGNQLFKMDE